MISSIRKPISSTMLAIVAVVVLSIFTAAVAQADSKVGEATFSAEADIVFVGFSLDPETTSKSKFTFDVGGAITKVRIRTKNEQVVGMPLDVLAGCSDDAGDAACDQLKSLLNGAIVKSLHKSTAELMVAFSSPFVLVGSLSGELKGDFTITSTSGHVLRGKTNLSISGTATYACWGPTGPGLLLTECEPGGSGQLFPIGLDVVDAGEFEIGKNKEAGIKSIEGDLTVTVLAPGGGPPFGKIEITNAVAELIVPKD